MKMGTRNYVKCQHIRKEEKEEALWEERDKWRGLVFRQPT
jgi:hypothetical protein